VQGNRHRERREIDTTQTNAQNIAWLQGDYKAAFREAARKRGIDPTQGANRYQVALVKAEAAPQARKKLDWLRYVPLPKDESPEGRDDVEHDTFVRIEAEARRHIRPVEVVKPAPTLVEAKTQIDVPLFRDLWRESVGELPPEALRRAEIVAADAAVKRTQRDLDVSEADAKRALQAARRAHERAALVAG
jgi:hypothetical protein